MQSGGGLDANGHTLTLKGSSPQTLTGALSFFRLTLDKAAMDNTVTVVGSLTVTDLLTINQGTLLSASDYVDVVIEVAGALVLTKDITVSGNWTNNGGSGLAFDPKNFKVTFDGAGTPQTLGGSQSTVFYDLEIAPGANLVLAKLPSATHSIVNNGLLTEVQSLTPGTLYGFLIGGETVPTAVTLRNFTAQAAGGLPLALGGLLGGLAVFGVLRLRRVR